MNEVIFCFLIGGWVTLLGLFLYWYLSKEEKNNRQMRKDD